MAGYKSIEFDFQAAIAQAERLEELASQVDKLRQQRLQASLDELRSVWQGKSAEEFQRKGEELQQDLKCTEQELKAIAQSIRATARRVYEAEMEALRMAESRSY
ncbi:MAG: WXG100 family type VII secretion target [Oscillospiraceae bacterium]|nr:WXG100 family type VII secretion target [Oscillospiraceae bacterium]